MNQVFLKLIRFYKLVLSPIAGRQCRFYPTCSDYAKGAFERHRFLYAMKLTAARILRCHPFSPGGVDLVP